MKPFASPIIATARLGSMLSLAGSAATAAPPGTEEVAYLNFQCLGEFGSLWFSGTSGVGDQLYLYRSQVSDCAALSAAVGAAAEGQDCTLGHLDSPGQFNAVCSRPRSIVMGAIAAASKAFIAFAP